MKLALPLLVVALALASISRAEVKPNALFSDNAVLQQGMPVPVWGTASPGEEVTVVFANQTKTAKADAAGKWLVKLDPMPASAEPRNLTISGSIGNQKCFSRRGLGLLRPVQHGHGWQG